MKKVVLFVLLAMGFVLAGCSKNKSVKTTGDSVDPSLKGIKIQMLNSKGEIQSSLENMALEFSQKTGIQLEILSCGAGQSPFEKIVSLYNSGNAPALYMGDANDLLKLKDKFKTLNDEKWMKDAPMTMLTGVTTADGSLLGFPITVEGYGFIYNKDVLDKAGVDPSTIHTIKDLDQAFSKVEASGTGSLIISPMDWSLAAHFLGIGYCAQPNGLTQNDLYRQLESGKMSVPDNKTINGLIDTFDVMIKHNTAKNDPLAVTYEKGPQLLGMKKVGFWFMGNWAWPQIETFTEDQNYGFIPVPVSNNPNDFGNSQIAVSVSKFLAVDTTQNSEKQQAAAREFLNWIVYSEEGQKALVEECNIIPAFQNNKFVPADPLGKNIEKFLADGKVYPFAQTPPDHWSVVGAYMQKYLAGKSDRKQLLSDIDSYWKKQNKQ